MTGFEICEIIIEHNNLPKNNDYFTGIMILTGKKNFMISINITIIDCAYIFIFIISSKN